jgi:hypothetical protein
MIQQIKIVVWKFDTFVQITWIVSWSSIFVLVNIMKGMAVYITLDRPYKMDFVRSI